MLFHLKWSFKGHFSVFLLVLPCRSYFLGSLWRYNGGVLFRLYLERSQVVQVGCCPPCFLPSFKASSFCWTETFQFSTGIYSWKPYVYSFSLTYSYACCKWFSILIIVTTCAWFVSFTLLNTYTHTLLPCLVLLVWIERAVFQACMQRIWSRGKRMGENYVLRWEILLWMQVLCCPIAATPISLVSSEFVCVLQ